MHKHSTWGVLSQGRNSKELTVRETHSGTLGFNGRQRPKPYQYLYVYFYLVNYFLGLALCVSTSDRAQTSFTIFYTLSLFIYILNKTVILKAPEDKRPKPEQVEGG
jgi:hypothetical protein